MSQGTAPVAVIDCGTNSIRLLVASLDADGRLVDHDRRLILNRLGQGVDATRSFAPEALERTFAACDEYAQAIAEFGAREVWFVATSAARDVSNRGEFFDGVRQRLGVEPDVIPGEEEARLSFEGALSGVPDTADPVLVIDVGGGSSELITGSRGHIDHAISLDIGSVRLRERCLTSDPPTADEVVAARLLVDELLDGSDTPFASIATFIGVAGTVTSLSAIHQGLAVYDRTKVHRSTLSRSDLTALSERLLTAPVADIIATTCLPPKRAEVICAGALIVEEIAKRVGAGQLVVSESDILDALALTLLRDERRPSR